MASQMERLGFEAEGAFTAIEAAIHLNRYLLARESCHGRTVLDIACGEGYGAWFMAERWAAAHVHAVDASPDAIRSARRFFSSPRIDYHCAAAEQLETLFEPATFDLIVSVETIEHLADPRSFLHAVQRLRRPDGVVIITCPNDHWYYRDREESNPFHVRKYTFEEFRDLAESVLGPARQLLLGTPLSGFINRPPDDQLVDRGAETYAAMLAAQESRDTLVVPTQERITWQNCLYYVGLWGPPSEAMRTTLVAYPCTTDTSEPATRQAQVEHLLDTVDHLRQQESDLQQKLAGIEKRLAARTAEVCDTEETRLRLERHTGMRMAALRAENEYVREQCADFRGHLNWTRQEFARTSQQLTEARRQFAAAQQQVAETAGQLARATERGDALDRQRAETAWQLAETLGRCGALEQQIAELQRSIQERDAYIHETWIAKFKRVSKKIARRLSRRPGAAK